MTCYDIEQSKEYQAQIDIERQKEIDAHQNILQTRWVLANLSQWQSAA